MSDDEKASKSRDGEKVGTKTVKKSPNTPAAAGKKKTTAAGSTKKTKKVVKKKRTVVTKTVVKPAPSSTRKGRNIGLAVPLPKKTCEDVNCPFHGNLSVRGQILEGIVVSTKMDKTAVVKKERLFYISKYERYEKRTSRYSVHNPPCLRVKTGDWVKMVECRPLSKTVSFVIVERRRPA